MKLAAIDIGSNAVRLQITKVIEYEGLITFKKLQFIRFPLRLGYDVFSTGLVSKKKAVDFLRLMRAFKTMIDLYEIDHYYGCATSAMREAENGQEIVEKTKKELDLQIEIISGHKEAEMTNRIIGLFLENRPYLHIDVGGGSTELNLYDQRKKIHSDSFQIGTVRNLKRGQNNKAWANLTSWIDEHIHGMNRSIMAIGTGGNINKMYELVEKAKNRKASLDQLLKVRDFLKNLSLEERMMRLQLNPDRADVIIPASTIYLRIMEIAHAKHMLVPDVGLKDGINNYLFEKYYPKKGKLVIRN